MRSILVSALILVLPVRLVAQEPKEKPKTVQPIKVIKLDRREPVLFEKDIEPILLAKCSFCHSGNVKESKLDLGSYDSLMKGGKRGAAVVPGKSADSLIVRLAGKTERPSMPPKSEEPLTPEELALLKLWIDQGAKAPTGQRAKISIALSTPPERVTPVRALAISADKSAIVASRGNQVHVYDAGSGAHVRTLVDPKLVTPEKKPVKAAHLALVESLACSPEGKYIASGAFQEVILWDAQTGAVRQRLTGFADRVMAMSFSPNGKLLATGGGAPTE